MNNIIANIRTQLQKLKCRIANLTKRVAYIEDNCCNGGGDSGIQSIQEGNNISVDDTDPQNPIISSTGVTSVGLQAPSGFTVTNSPITTSGTLALDFQAGYSIPTNSSQSNWDTAYGWGNHADVGYLTTETDPTVPSHVKAITSTQVSNWDTAYSQRIQNLTTTGSSGAATLNSNTLNIPNYTLAGLGGVPLIRTITINGVEQDLSANRSWNLSEIVFYTTEPSNGEEGKLYISVLTGEMKIWTSGAWLGLTFSLHTEDTNDIEFTGDGTPTNPLQATVGNKIPYKAIDTSVVEPDLAQLNAHGTDRVDFPNLNRIYLLNGAKWTYVETIDL